MFFLSKLFAAARRVSLFALTALWGRCFATPAWADGIPQAWGIGMQDPVSPIQVYIEHYHNILLWLISFISLFVLALLIYVVVRYNKWTNPTPSKTTHNVKLEIIWTLIPTLILLVHLLRMVDAAAVLQRPGAG